MFGNMCVKICVQNICLEIYVHIYVHKYICIYCSCMDAASNRVHWVWSEVDLLEGRGVSSREPEDQ